MLIFEQSQPGRTAAAQLPAAIATPALSERFLRTTPIGLPEVSELQAVRHYTNLSRKNFSQLGSGLVLQHPQCQRRAHRRRHGGQCRQPRDGVGRSDKV